MIYFLSYFHPCFRKKEKPFNINVSSLNFISFKRAQKYRSKLNAFKKATLT